jgi:hypothetical protein
MLIAKPGSTALGRPVVPRPFGSGTETASRTSSCSLRTCWTMTPPFYQELGARQKGDSERALLQREVDQSAECLGVLPFKVTPSQEIALKTFDFAGISMAEVGTGVLPLSIIPPDTTSLSADRAITNNHARSETYDLSGDPSSGALSTADTPCLRNQNGYLPWDWMDARSQLRGNLALLGSLCGNDHATTLNWQTMLRRFEGTEARLQHEMNTHHGPRLAPALFVFHLQLIERDCFVESTITGQRTPVPAPDFCQYLRVFERHNNLHWLPSVTNVPALLALIPSTVTHCPVATPRAPAVPRGGGATPAAASECRDPGPRVRNPARDARFTGNTAFARNVRSRCVDEAIALAGGDSAIPRITRGEEESMVCILFHAKGACYGHCLRLATHPPLSPSEATLFNAWCAVAFA